MKWIRVEDSLPDDNTFKVVMVQTSRSIITFRFPLMAAFLKGEWKSCGLDMEPVDLPKDGEVTHWITPPTMAEQ